MTDAKTIHSSKNAGLCPKKALKKLKMQGDIDVMGEVSCSINVPSSDRTVFHIADSKGGGKVRVNIIARNTQHFRHHDALSKFAAKRCPVLVNPTSGKAEAHRWQ